MFDSNKSAILKQTASNHDLGGWGSLTEFKSLIIFEDGCLNLRKKIEQSLPLLLKHFFQKISSPDASTFLNIQGLHCHASVCFEL